MKIHSDKLEMDFIPPFQTRRENRLGDFRLAYPLHDLQTVNILGSKQFLAPQAAGDKREGELTKDQIRGLKRNITNAFSDFLSYEIHGPVKQGIELVGVEHRVFVSETRNERQDHFICDIQLTDAKAIGYFFGEFGRKSPTRVIPRGNHPVTRQSPAGFPT
jgi:hypothetical protein